MKIYFKSVIIVLVGALLAFWFIRRLDWGTVGIYLRGARLWPLAVAVLLVNLAMFARSLRWQAFLAPSAQVSLRSLFAATSIGFGALFVIGRAGEIVRPAVLSLQERLRPSLTLSSALIERIYDTAVIILLFSVNMLYFEFPPGSRFGNSVIDSYRTVGLLTAGALLLAISLLVALRLRANLILRFLETRLLPRAPRLFRPVISFVHHLTEGLSVLTNLRELGVTIFHTAIIWTLIIGSSWITLTAFNLDFSLSQLIFILGFGVVGSLVPTPGGSAGAYHAVTAHGYELLGIEPNLAACLAIVGHLIGFGPPFFLALYFLVRDDISLASIRGLLADGPVGEGSEADKK